jgi:hypothetical protein
MTVWNEFRRHLSSQLTTTGIEEQGRLYQQAKDKAALQGVEQPSPRFLANLAANLVLDLGDAPLGIDGDLSDLDSEDDAQRAQRTITQRRLRELREMQEEASDPDELDFNPTKLEFGDALDDALNTTDIDMRENLLRSIMDQHALPVVGPLGRPLPMEKLLQMAQLQPIWRDLSDEQRAAFLDSAGFLRDGKPYVSKRIVEKPLPVRKTLIQLADGTKLRV